MSETEPTFTPVVDGTESAVLAPYESPAREKLRRFMRHRLAVVGAVVLFIVLMLAIFAPLVAQDPFRTDLSLVRAPPSADHWLGGDLAGRDVWSRVVYGTRTSIVVGVAATALYVVIGTLLGLVAGFGGGILDQVVMRIADAIMSIPLLLIVVVFIAVIGPSLQSVIIVIGLLGWPAASRVVRGQTLALRESEFVIAARVSGARTGTILFRHILPNLLSTLIVVATLGVATSIVIEASLSFLGLGVRPPTPSLGVMVNEARSPNSLQNLPWLWAPPAVMIAMTVLAVNFVGDGLRDAFDPRSAASGKVAAGGGEA
jgi:peptide/nickel transport system permease protein